MGCLLCCSLEGPFGIWLVLSFTTTALRLPQIAEPPTRPAKLGEIGCGCCCEWDEGWRYQSTVREIETAAKEIAPSTVIVKEEAVVAGISIGGIEEYASGSGETDRGGWRGRAVRDSFFFKFNMIEWSRFNYYLSSDLLQEFQFFTKSFCSENQTN